tara:strand:- start:93 stop:803 length:711 start_codon:yes stop_codon:yes gene_type:complete
MKNNFFIISFLISLIIFCCYNLGKNYKQVDIDMCFDINIKDKNRKYKILKNLVPDYKCNQLINEGEIYASKNKWSTKRHGNYPTTDNKVDESWNCYKYFENLVKTKVYDTLYELYKVDISKLYILELFLVKYDEKGQKSLDFHIDETEFSFIITLNNDFKGGGTLFKNSNKLIKPNKGDCLVFSGRNKHKGNAISRGTRYILAGFIGYKDYKFCQNLIMKVDPKAALKKYLKIIKE